jgi:hypothetical protein
MALRTQLLLSGLIVLALLGQGPATAQNASSPSQVWINAGTYSYHFDHSKSFRNNNIGIGAEWRLTPEQGIIAGHFINSNDLRSRYLAYQWRPLNTSIGPTHWGVGVDVGAMNGYPYHNGAWFALVMPEVFFEYKRVGFNLFFVPKVGDRVDSAISLQAKVRVW